jgi:hypothetical protein
MGKVIPLNTIKDLAKEIDRLFSVVQDSERRAERARMQAGRLLLELRARIEAGEAGAVTWWRWYCDHIAHSHRDAEKVMALARAQDPEAAYQEENRKRRERYNQFKLAAQKITKSGVTLPCRDVSEKSAASQPVVITLRGELNESETPAAAGPLEQALAFIAELDGPTQDQLFAHVLAAAVERDGPWQRRLFLHVIEIMETVGGKAGRHRFLARMLGRVTEWEEPRRRAFFADQRIGRLLNELERLRRMRSNQSDT